MAERRMFSKTIVDSDAFLDMPLSSQALYFHLSMRADDDGFVNNPTRIVRLINASANDLDLLVMKSFILKFESGVIVIKHWKINNYLRADRYKGTSYTEEKTLLQTKENGSYTFGIPSGIPVVDAGKDRIGKDNIHVEFRKNSTSENMNLDKEQTYPEGCSELDTVTESAGLKATNLKETATEFSAVDIIDKLCKLYCTGRNNKTESRKLFLDLLSGRKRFRGEANRVRLNHLQLYYAIRQYMKECTDKELEADKILLLSTFLNGRVLDYAELTRENYEKYMQTKYREKWREVKFTYV